MTDRVNVREMSDEELMRAYTVSSESNTRHEAELLRRLNRAAELQAENERHVAQIVRLKNQHEIDVATLDAFRRERVDRGAHIVEVEKENAQLRARASKLAEALECAKKVRVETVRGMREHHKSCERNKIRGCSPTCREIEQRESALERQLVALEAEANA